MRFCAITEVMALNVRSVRWIQLQVINRVVQSIVVFVMNNFFALKFPSNALFHYIAMLKNSFSVNRDHSIPAMVDITALEVCMFAVPSRLAVALSRTENLLSSRLLEFRLAIGANMLFSHKSSVAYIWQ